MAIRPGSPASVCGKTVDITPAGEMRMLSCSHVSPESVERDMYTPSSAPVQT